MIENKTHSEKTSAADIVAAFDFQYYYFLSRLLSLKIGETVGLEVLDDVHTELADSRQILVQIKHTTQTKADGSAKNLTTLDEDLWKSLSNWVQIITDPNAGRSTENAQMQFLCKTEFLLVSNKTENEDNSILKQIKQFQAGSTQYTQLVEAINELKNKTRDEGVQGYLQEILDLNSEVGEEFFRNIHFELNLDDILTKCKKAIKEDKIAEDKIDEVFRNLDSQIRQDNFIDIKNNTKIIIRFEDFYKKYRRHYDLARNPDLLTIKPFDGNLPDNLVDQKFIQQLLDIKDIKADNFAAMAKYTGQRLQMQNNIDDWYREGDLTNNELSAFDREAASRWENKYNQVYRQCKEDEVPAKALEVLDAMREEKLSISSQPLSTDLSNGQYYRLSNTPEIGWHKDWKEKYS